MDSKTALLSVFDKSGLLDLAKGLAKNGFRLLGSGGTAKVLQEAGFEVEAVESITKSPEILGGRVKTLHPAVHGGILARDIDTDKQDLAKLDISLIDVVVVNLYPFQNVVSQPAVTLEEAVENVDIGGVALLRAAAKNHKRVTCLSSPSQYWDFLKEQDSGGISQDTRNLLALEAFETTASYDEAISDYFRKKYASNGVQHLSLRYGCNPHQKPAAAFVQDPHGKLPFSILNGSPGYINLLDALNAWQLVKELRAALGYAAAASFKHVSPAGAAIGVPLTQLEKEVYFVDDIDGLDQSQLACAYARARGADRMSSYGDMIALSDTVDVPTAKIISREVSDGVIAPSYSPEAIKILSAKKGGKFLLLQMSPEFEPISNQEYRTLFGVTLSQHRNDAVITPDMFKAPQPLPESALRDLTVVTLATKYTQSNSVGYGLNGQVIGLGAGGQSRIGMTRQAGEKADNWWMRFHERSLHLKWKKGVKRADKANAIDMLCGGHVPETGPERLDWEGKFEEVPPLFTQEERRQWLSKLSEVACSSDAFFPFTDNVYRACRSGAKYIAAPLGSQADEQVKEAAEKLGAVFIEQPTRLFHH